MRRCWPLHEAKNKFSEVVHRAETEGPQVVTVRGREAVVVVSAKRYRELVEPKKSLLDALRDPSIRLLDDDEAEMIFGRIPDYGRPAPDFEE